MDFKSIIRMALKEFRDDLRKHLDGLTLEERRFQPTLESNHIDFVVWHMARVEDDFIQRFAQRIDTLWETDDWHQKLGLPDKGNGFQYTAGQVKELPVYDHDLLMDYYDRVRELTLGYLNTLTAEDLEFCPHPRRPQYSVGEMFSHLIVEESQHVGHVAFIRGLQRGIES